MVSVYKASAVTDAVIVVLTDAGLRVGDGKKPAGSGYVAAPGQSAFNPYVVVQPVDGTSDGPLDDCYADVGQAYIIRSFGGTRVQADGAAEDVRAAMLSASWSIPDRKVMSVDPEVEAGSAPEDQVQPSVWAAPSRWRIWTTPA